MDIVPVIDLKSGLVVHARGGRRDAYQPIETPLAPSAAPQDVVSGLLALYPFRRLYIADLDAIAGLGKHHTILATLSGLFPTLELWVDGGIGTWQAARYYLDSGAGYLVLGSESQTDLSLLRRLRGNARVILSLDFRGDSFQGSPEILDATDLWPQRVIVMSLSRVGAGEGPDLDRVGQMVQRHPRGRIYAAGGVRNRDDLAALRDIGAAGALVATALHNGALGTADLNAIARH